MRNIFAASTFVLVTGAIVISELAPRRETCQISPHGRCLNNLKMVAIGLLQYSQDYDEHLPLVAEKSGNSYGWADGLYPYIKNVSAYQCPLDTEKKADDPRKRGYTDHWFNANLSGKSMQKIAAPAKRIAFGDGNYKGDLTDARYSLAALPQTWIDDKKSPAYRHNGGANYAFADGHVKMLKPE